MKHRVTAFLCAAAMFAGWVPTDVFAAENQMTMGFDLVNTSGHEVLMPGDEISVDMWVADAGWTSGFNGAIFGIEFDEDILEAKKGSGTLNETLTSMDGIYDVDLADMKPGLLSVAYMPGISQYYEENCTGKLTDEKMSLLTYTLVVKDPLPADRLEDMQLDCFVSTFSVGTDCKEDSHMFEMVDSDSFQIVTNYDLRVDTHAPTITVGDGTTDTFAYAPVPVTVTGDDGDLASVKLDGTELTADENGCYWVDKSGTITAEDRYGNAATKQVTLQADAFLAAKAAAAQLPAAQDVLYSDGERITQAQQALDNVTDPAAKQQLAAEQDKVTQARQAWEAIRQCVDEVKAKIDALTALPEDAPLHDVLAALQEIDDQLHNETTGLFTTQGVQEKDLENYAAYQEKQQASQAILAKIQDLQQQIDALPDRDQVTLAHRETVEALKQAVSSAETQYGEGLLDKTRLEEADARLTELTQEREEAIRTVKEQIAALPAQDAVRKEDETAIRAARQALKALQEAYQEETILSSQETERLVQAEAALQALETEAAAVQQAIDTLYGDSAEEVLYTQKEAIHTLQQRVTALSDKGYQVNTDKLDQAAAQITLLEQEEQAVADAIAALGDPEQFVPSEENIQAVSQIQTRLDALEKRGMTAASVAGYDRYTAICEQMAQALQEIADVKAKIAALPAAEQIRFDTDIQSVRAAVTELQGKYGAQILSAAELQPLTDAEARRAALDTQRAALVDELKNFAPEIGLSEEKQAVIRQMRQRVTDMTALGTAFSAQELENLVKAEQALADLEEESKQLHADIAALYVQDASEIRYHQKQTIQQLQQDLERLEQGGDASFTEAERQKLDQAAKAIADMETRQAALTRKIRALPQDAVRYSQKDDAAGLQEEMTALDALGIPVEQADQALFANFLALVNTMNGEIDAVNGEMDTALKDWTFDGEQAPFDAIRQKMDALVTRYQIPEEEKAEVFPRYNTSVEKQQQAETLLQQAGDGIDALPEQVTLADEAAVNTITSQLQQLRTLYGFTDEVLQEELFDKANDVDRLAQYQAAVKRINALKKPAGQGGQQTDNGTAQSSTPSAQQTPAPTAAPAPTEPQQTAAVTIPQTADPLPVEGCTLIAVLALAGFALALRKKRQEK